MSSSSSPCAACKFLRRKCTQGCVFSPYFPPDQPTKFANVHRVFGASNVAKLLNELPAAQREDAVNSLAYEAEARLRDPVYGCVGYISLLQHKINQIKDDLKSAKRELAAFVGPAALGPFLPPHHSPFVSAAGVVGAPFHQSIHHGPPSYGVAGMGMGLGLSAAPQMQQQMVDAQHLAAVAAAAAAAREQEMLRTLEQQQQQNEMARFNSGFVDGRGGFGHNGGNGGAASSAAGTSSGASPPAGLALVSPQQFDSQFHVQSQSQQQQQQQIQLHQYMEQHRRAGSDEGRSGIGPAS